MLWRTLVAAGGLILAVTCGVLIHRTPAELSPPEIAAEPQARLAALRQAVWRDAASPYRWCDLGEALLDADNRDEAAYCMQKARELGPTIPAVWVRSANLHFRTGDGRAALREYARVLAIVPDYDGVVFSTVDRMAPEVKDIIREIGTNRRGMQSYLGHLMATRQVVAAATVWTALRARQYTENALAVRYVDFLLGQQLYQVAADAWHQYAGGSDGQSLLFNGGFETVPTGSALDWHLESDGAVEVARDNQVAKTGRWSLRVRFPGDRNLDFRGVWQAVVAPVGSCELRALIRTDGITTDQGVRLRVFDADHPDQLDAVTEDWKQTRDWTPVVQPFYCSGHTRLLRVELCRRLSLKFDNKVAGTVWLDDVRLQCTPQVPR
jgi:hypothetical protein